jgi:hypothetical protein
LKVEEFPTATGALHTLAMLKSVSLFTLMEDVLSSRF